MQRLIARFLLLFAVAGLFVPPALQASGAPNHFCCRRAAQHRCHSYALTDPQQLSVYAPGCSQNCRRAVATSQWADPEPSRSGRPFEISVLLQTEPHSVSLAIDASSARSTRAPPA